MTLTAKLYYILYIFIFIIAANRSWLARIGDDAYILRVNRIPIQI